MDDLVTLKSSSRSEGIISEKSVWDWCLVLLVGTIPLTFCDQSYGRLSRESNIALYNGVWPPFYSHQGTLLIL